ncbi:MAG TPA: trypsin-like peptidase domain-containing protein [Parasegetibacter sp.]
MNMKQTLSVVLISAVTSVLSVWGYSKLMRSDSAVFEEKNNIPVNYANFVDKDGSLAAPVDFTQASAIGIPAVVHIKTKIPAKRVNTDSFFDSFFGFGPTIIPEQRASGSGVITSENGYIVTNYHVISDNRGGIADDIQVTLSNKKTYTAKVVGHDPGTDLAVLKIDDKGLPYLNFGNSDHIKIGQWVLAIGYPLNLETTVTAGIVSAKGRTLDINSRQSNNAVEAFIQTDAAVNQGNSGGALINAAGELIGINSAIASPTGYYSGYSYAIPSNLVKKIASDIIKYGSVQRAYLGIEYDPRFSDEQRKKLNVQEGEGVYVGSVVSNGAAADAGIKAGDVITKVNGETVSTGPQLVGIIASYKVGEKVNITFKRNGKEYTTAVTLKNSMGNFDIIKVSILDKLGADFADVDKSKLAKLGLKGGVEVRNIGKGLIAEQTRMVPGFIIIRAGKYDVTDVKSLEAAISKSGSSTTLEGIYPNEEGIYYYSINNLNR